jgi:hypothetical protein
VCTATFEAAGGYDPDNTIVLSRDLSPWKAEHLFATDKNVPDEDTTSLSGDFVTKVFEGPYREAKSWYSEMENVVRSRGKDPARIYFYYTTCPKCAAAMGKNYVVGLAKSEEDRSMDSETHAQIIEILDTVNDMTIATLRSDGFPQANVVSFVHANLKIYFMTVAGSQKALNLLHSDKVSGTVTRPTTAGTRSRVSRLRATPVW